MRIKKLMKYTIRSIAIIALLCVIGAGTCSIAETKPVEHYPIVEQSNVGIKCLLSVLEEMGIDSKPTIYSAYAINYTSTSNIYMLFEFSVALTPGDLRYSRWLIKTNGKEFFWEHEPLDDSRDEILANSDYTMAVFHIQMGEGIVEKLGEEELTKLNASIKIGEIDSSEVRRLFYGDEFSKDDE